MTVLRQVNIVVRDMDAMAAFYERLGVRLRPSPPAWAPHHRNSEPADDGADLDLDSPAFAAVWDAGWPAGAAGIVVTFEVADRAEVDRLYDELTAAGHAGAQPPYDAFWGSRFALVVDPDGNHVGLGSPPDPTGATAPPAPPG